MPIDPQQDRQQAHALLDLLPPAKLGAVRTLSQVMIDVDDEDLTEADIQALRASDERLRNGAPTLPFEQLVADLGFAMDEVRTGDLRSNNP